ncbi:MAG TPA: autotransporter-associated beta strand repeat-containing protein, partial [Pirellulales bacterium]
MSSKVIMAANSSIGSNSLSSGGDITINDITINGALSGAYALTKVGGDTLTLTAANTYSGATTVALGTLALSGAGKTASAITVDPSATLSITDNSASPTSSRLEGKTLALDGGTFNYTGSSTGNSTETVGALTLNAGESLINITAGGSETATVTFASLTATAVGNAAEINLGTGAALKFTTVPTLVPATTGILARDVVTSGGQFTFATYTSSAGIAPFTAYTSNINTTGATVQATANLTATASRTINALAFNGSGITVSGSANTILTITSGGLLNTGGDNTLSAPTLAFSTVEGIVHVDMDTTLTISSVITGSAGLTKADSGTLVLDNANAYYGATTVDSGTLQLAAANAIYYFPTTASTTGGFASAPASTTTQLLAIGAGATLDLDGNSLWAPTLGSTTGSSLPGTSGIITNTSATPVTLRVGENATETFAGQITGSSSDIINFQKEGGSTLTLTNANKYYGTTAIMGGVTIVQDLGTLENTSAISITHGVLEVNDSGLEAVANRLPSDVPITLAGGTLNLISASGTNASYSVGAVTLAYGENLINLNIGNSISGSGAGTSSLAIASLAAPTNPGTSITFAATVGNIGSNPFITLGTAPTLTNGLIGAWATVYGVDPATSNTSANIEFATYDPAVGISTLPVAAYTTSFAAITDPSNNLRLNTNATVTNGGATINSLTFNGATAARTLSFANPNDVLNVQSGGIILGSEAYGKTIGSGTVPGELTAGGATATGNTQQLYIYVGNSTTTINSQIVDNPNGDSVALVLSGVAINAPNVILSQPAGFANSYTGGTYVNGINVYLDSASGPAIPGNLTISGDEFATSDGNPLTYSTTTLSLSAQIAATATVTLNGDSALNLSNYNNTIANLVFHNDGGAGSNVGPTLETGLGVLTVTGTISSLNPTNSFVVANLDGNLDLNGAGTFYVDPVVGEPIQMGLSVTGAMSDGSLTLTGGGVLGIGGTSTYTGPTNITSGTLVFNNNNAFIGDSSVNVGPLGTLDTRGVLGTIGSLTGSGAVINYSYTTGTLVTGADNTDTTFSGTFNEALTGVLNVWKMGTGNLTLTGDSSNSTLGAMIIDGGRVTYADNGQTAFTMEPSVGGTLVIDDTGTNLTGRLAAVTMLGGTLDFAVNASAPSSETATGALTLSIGGGELTFTNPDTQSATLSFSSLSVGVGGSLNIVDPNLGTTDLVTFHTAPALLPASGGILAAVTVNGADFATYSASTGITAFTNYNAGNSYTNINSAGTTDTVQITSAFTGYGATTLAGTGAHAQSGTINALSFSGDGLSLGAELPDYTLTLTSGGVLSTGGDNTLNVPVLAFGAVKDVFHVDAGASLTVNSMITGSAGLIKADAGSMTLAAPQFFTGTVYLNAGTLTLSSGQDNTIMVEPNSTTPTLSALYVGSGSLDLDGYNQQIGYLSSANPISGSGGVIENTSTTPVTLSIDATSTTTYSGTFSGELSLAKYYNSTLTLNSASTNTGTLTVGGGNLTLRDAGAVGTSTVNVNNAIFTLDNSGLSDLSNPLPADATINLSGGTFAITPREEVGGALEVGTVDLVRGGDAITLNAVGVGAGYTLTIDNLEANSDATVIFTSAFGAGTQLGQVNQGQIIINELNGAAFSAASLTNNIIGGWAVVDGTDFASYLDGSGVGALSTPGFPTYDATSMPAATAPTENIKVSNTSITVPNVASYTLNTLDWSTNSASDTFTFSSSTGILNLAAGGLLKTGNYNNSIGSAVGNGQITAGGTQSSGTADLYLYNNYGTLTVNSQIVNNPNGASVRLVISGGTSTTVVASLTDANTYTGGTVVNAGTLSLNGAAGAVVIPAGGLALSSATLTMVTNAGQIDPSNDVTLNGDSKLTLTGSNTLSSLTFNNRGGNSTPTAATSTSLTLSAANAITSANDNTAYTPTISGTALVLSNANPVINVSGASPVDLIISSPITAATTGNILITGGGSVVLGATNTFAGGVTLDTDTSIIFSNAAGAGTGPLTISDGGTLLSATTAETVTNSTTINGNFTFGGT